MLELIVVMEDRFNQDTQQFVLTTVTLELEHSLATLSKWEQKYKVPFLSSDKDIDQLNDYIKMMSVVTELTPEILERFSEANYMAVNDYLADEMTATWFNETRKEKQSTKILTNELVYSWLVTLRIPFEVEHWHLNRLFTLIRVVNIENAPPKKMSAGEQARQQREMNERRRAQQGGKG